MTSSSDDLLSMFSNQFVSNQMRNKSQQQRHQSSNSDYSFEKIRNMLNLQLEGQEQLEGNFQLPLFGGKRLFTFDNHTIEQLPKRKYFLLI